MTGFLIGLVLGGFVGICVMALFQIKPCIWASTVS